MLVTTEVMRQLYNTGSDPSYASYLYGRAQAMYTFATSYQASYANNTQACIKVHSVSQLCLYASQAEVQRVSAADPLCMSFNLHSDVFVVWRPVQKSYKDNQCLPVTPGVCNKIVLNRQVTHWLRQ